MAFSFLGDIGNIVQGVGGIASLFDDRDMPAGAVSMQKAINEAIKMAKASADPNSPQFKNLVALEEEQNRISAIQGVKDYLGQAARSKARGHTGQIINPERRDEAVMQSLARAFMMARENARNTARGTLQDAAGVLTGAGQASGTGALIQNEVNAVNEGRSADRFQAIGAGLGSLGDILDKRFPSTPRGTAGSTRTELY